VEPVAQRLLTQFKNAKAARKAAIDAKDDKAAQAAKDQMDALVLFRSDMVTYERAYTFLSQIFDYGNTDFEKRAIFYKHLLRLLKFGLERDSVDLSQVVLTHHKLKDRGKQAMKLADGEYPKLPPITEAGSGTVQEKEKAYLRDIIEKLNSIFGGDTTDGDQLSFVKAITSKMAESATLRTQASANGKEQFASSPDLTKELLNANIGSLDAFTELGTQVLNSPETQRRLLLLLLGPAKLYEMLRGQA